MEKTDVGTADATKESAPDRDNIDCALVEAEDVTSIELVAEVPISRPPLLIEYAELATLASEKRL